jgi:hypothetical protein
MNNAVTGTTNPRSKIVSRFESERTPPSMRAYRAGGTTRVTGFSISRLTSAMNCAAVAP